MHNRYIDRKYKIAFIITIVICAIGISGFILWSALDGAEKSNEDIPVETTTVVTGAVTEVTEVVEPETTQMTTRVVETEPIMESAELPTETAYIEETEPVTTIVETEVVEAAEMESTEPEPELNMDDVEMLAIVIYQEVGGDMHCDECRRRVADVVLNRVADDRFPDTIYGVLTQPEQYGRLAWTGVVWASRASNPYEADAVERAYRIAREVLSGQHSDLYGNGYVWQAGFVQGTDNIYCCGHYFGR